ncbi:hypothetical protein GGP50_002572 [Salinibacter ruber]|jgi:hypothetical protein|uniref:hypothetical protein n=1 Tax=Salinibacter ruber TaxID=146919 RepID=UPI002169338E|nr:hypothetical protein [Salinibacter ruber]MCS4194346.1 hypothetical protein [Salinibacter ruber]
MSVPFEEIGSGQKGRLAYQVMGDGGPIPNPKGIRYLPPDSAPSPTPDSIPVGPSGVGGALAATGLLLQAAELGVETHNALKLRQIESHLQKVLPRLDRIESSLKRIEGKLDTVLKKIESVQKMQAQKTLRTDLEFILEKKHVQDEGIDLEGLAEDVLEVIKQFEEHGGLNIRLGDARGLDLSVEARSYLEQVFELLHTIRRSTYEAVNYETQADPTQVLRVDLQEDYWPSDTASYEMTVLTIQGLHWGLKRKVQNYISNHFDRIFEDADPVAYRLRPLFYNEVDEDLEPEVYEAFKKWWVWGTDAGLLYRVRKEAQGISDGYQSAFDVNTHGLPESDSGPLFNVALPKDREELDDLVEDVSTPSR